MTYKSGSLQTAKKMADDLCIQAYWHEYRCNWTGIFHHSQIANSEVVLRALPSNIYDGSAGIAFFLSAIYHVFYEDIYHKTAIGAWERTISQIPKIREERIGFYEGMGGIAFALTLSGKWLKSEKLLLEGLKLAENLKINNQMVGFDLMNGVAGAILALNAIHQEFPNECFKQLICRGGSSLLSNVKYSKKGISWKNNTISTGYSQGNAGIIHALAVVYSHCQDPKYLDIIRLAVAYENSFFSEKYQNWKDLRLLKQSPKNRTDMLYMTNAWCSGAAGIGLSRIKTYQITKQDFLLEDVQKAASILLNKNFENTQICGLCHGLVGDLYLLHSYNLFLDSLEINAKINQGFAQLAPMLENLNFPDSQHYSLQNPSFMQGRAGIAYFFLSLDVKNLPNMLSIC